MDIDRPVAVIGAPESFSVSGVSGVFNTNLSAETAIRSGFDILLASPPESRRDARDMLRLAEEAGVRVGFPRWLRRRVENTSPEPFVSILAPVDCGMDHLLDLALWLSGSTGIRKIEARSSGNETMIVLSGPATQLMSIQTSSQSHSVHLSLAGGSNPRRCSVEFDAEAGLQEETLRFSARSPDSVLLEDSMDLIGGLERVGSLGR